MEENINKGKNKVYVLIADQRGLRQNKQGSNLEKIRELGIKEDIIKCFTDIYIDTTATIKIKNMSAGLLELNTGVRQGCSASPTLYNISIADLKQEMEKAQEEGIVIKGRKLFTITYADIIAPLATSIEGIKEMMKKLEKYLRRKGLELNAEKKLLIFRKSYKERSKKVNLNWNGTAIETVKEFNYLGYTFFEDNSNGKLVWKLAGKAKSTSGRVWSIG